MKINLKFYGRFSEIFQIKEGQIDLKNGANVRDLLNLLCSTDERRRTVFDKSNKNLRPNVVIRKNGRFIVHLEWLDTKLVDGDNVEILTLVSGG